MQAGNEGGLGSGGASPSHKNHRGAYGKISHNPISSWVVSEQTSLCLQISQQWRQIASEIFGRGWSSAEKRPMIS